MAQRTDWLVGESEIAELIRSTDWSRTPLGPLESWPENLRTTVSLVLASSFPINLIWGDEAIQIWNDAYAVICGPKHPAEFGTDYRVCWASAWPAIGDAFETARSGRTAYLTDQAMFLDRLGHLEETWFTFSLSPIRDERGTVVGLFHPVSETTARNLSERRMRTLRDLTSRISETRSVEAAIEAAGGVFDEAVLDLPLAALYLGGDAGSQRLKVATGLADGAWPLPEILPGDAGAFRGIVTSAYGEPLEQALLLPVTPPGVSDLHATLVLGLSNRLPLGGAYETHLELVGQAVMSGLGSAVAYERQRERAEQLAELDRAKTTFFSNISHELRTPLTLMLGPLEEELAHGPRNERLEMAHRNGLRLLRLVNSLLEFSRVEAGRIDAAFEPTDLAAFTADLASLFRSAVERVGMELDVSCPPLPEPIWIDRAMWEKVVTNLLSNAFKHTFEGVLEVRIDPRPEHGARLTVRDTGIGISAEELPHLFDRFHRVQGSRTRSIEGTGIGLALVNEYVALHDGRLGVVSVPGEGTTFTVDLQGGHAHLAADHLRERAGVAAESGWASARVDEALGWIGVAEPIVAGTTTTLPRLTELSGGRVLVADDNDDMRRHIAHILGPHFAVVTCGDGQSALDAALEDPPDVLLTDVMMPGLDGFELLAALRADDRTRTVPVIMLSARAGEEAAVEGLAAGADDYLVKPFASRDLLARVSSTMQLSRLRRETEHRLAQANAELVALARDKSEFAANLSHEIRTPLNAIIGMTSLLLDAGLAGESREFAKEIEAAGDHLLALVNDVLDFSKLEAGELGLHARPFAIADCVATVTRLVSGAAAEKGVTVQHDVGPGVPGTVVGDEGRLRQILLNLLSNAVKFTAAGTVRLTVSAPAPGELAFAVADTGMGIAPDQLERLFDAFKQAHGPLTSPHEGTGLGLTIARRLARVMGGDITVASTPGLGSVFTLTARLPTAAPAQEPLAILVVEDHPVNIEVVTRMLKRLGQQAEVATNGPAAIERMSRRRYDLVLMDVQLPGMDGFETVRQALAAGPGPRRIVGLSGYSSDETRRACLAAGMDDYITKPISLGRLAQVLEAL